jgi:hypothetical protein
MYVYNTFATPSLHLCYYSIHIIVRTHISLEMVGVQPCVWREIVFLLTCYTTLVLLQVQVSLLHMFVWRFKNLYVGTK